MTLFSNTQIEIADLPKSEDLNLNLISPKYFKIILFNTILVYALFVAAFLTFNLVADEPEVKTAFWYFLVVACVLCAISVLFFAIGFKKRKYAMRQKDITYSHGYLLNKTITLPYNRIQHIEIARSFLARKLGLSTLKIYSAGQSGGDLAIKGLPEDIAETQYAFLTKIINERS
ncbi:PH domain-containing protein [uncultured Winogradskyella sp.]|uniref:PH domain-containing protein n=1 Tax=uncultured Winogradskyella sp. TaxID=395353 RepID=UPI0030DB52C2|tara:strand:- start:212249 stop:212770 length:522 start_codon:yes stop_codon:yes gene_type:complete